ERGLGPRCGGGGRSEVRQSGAAPVGTHEEGGAGSGTISSRVAVGSVAQALRPGRDGTPGGVERCETAHHAPAGSLGPGHSASPAPRGLLRGRRGALWRRPSDLTARYRSPLPAPRAVTGF